MFIGLLLHGMSLHGARNGAGFRPIRKGSSKYLNMQRIKPPRSKLRGMNCAFPSSRFPTGLRRKRRGILPEEIDAPHTAETRIESRPAHRHFVHGKQKGPRQSGVMSIARGCAAAIAEADRLRLINGLSQIETRIDGRCSGPAGFLD
jgi:hypothetical protein